MNYRNGNYTAFYVAEPFLETNLGARTARDFCFYNLLKAWKEYDSTFPFIDSHEKNYNVRDGSSWDWTLRPRLHERLRNSTNIILFLSRVTKNSCALREEIEYGICNQGLPIIVIYPDVARISAGSGNDMSISREVREYWNKIPALRDNINKVPTLHIPLIKDLIIQALSDKSFHIQTKSQAKQYFYIGK